MIQLATMEDVPRSPAGRKLRRFRDERRAMNINLGISIPGSATLKGAGAFDGNFATLFPTAFQVVQSDRGFTYGSTLLATGAAPPVITISGTPAVPVPVRVECTLAGAQGVWQGRISFDDGATFPQAFTSSALPVPLAGPGAGLALGIAAGTASLDNVWRATCAGLQDQTANGKHSTQAIAAAQPVITVGLNGKVGLLFDGVNDFLRTTVQTIVTAFSFQVVVVGRMLQPGVANQSIFGTNAFCCALYTPSANNLRQYNGSAGNTVAFASTAPSRFSALFTNSTADELRAGASFGTGTNAGNSIPSALPTQVEMGSFSALGSFGNVEVFCMIVTPPTGLAAFEAAINSVAGYGPGSIAV